MMSGEIILEALPLPVLILGSENEILYGNPAAEVFFDIGLRMLQRQRLSDRVPFASPVFALVAEVRRRQASVSEYRVDIGSPRIGMDRIVDAFAAPMQDAGHALLMLHERRIADKMDRQLTHRSAARSITALGAMLAHEIKNPLAGIRGAAQLLEQNAGDEDRLLTQLICDEADRIVMLVERVELFGEERPEEREPVNVHGIIDQVKRSAQSGFARHIRFVERYDPSLPPVFGHRDQLTQTLLNLVKNAAEAIGPDANEGEILLSTAYKTGISVQSPGTFERISLPIELCVQDNGGGVPLNIGADLFDPFVTTKIQGTGLGLALVAKVVGDHGGIVEYESGPRRTVFRVLLPMYHAPNGRAA